MSMKPYYHRIGIKVKRPVIERIEAIHPFKMINYLLMSVVSLLYATISFMFIKHLAFELNGIYDFTLPKFFTVSTLLLLTSVYISSRMIGAYKSDKISLLKKLLSFTLISGILFFVTQSISWIELLAQNTDEELKEVTIYLFTFSAVHLTFVLIGMIMSGILFYRYMLIENDPIKTLIVTTNPVEKVKLEVFRSFWHFNVFSWTLIFMMLLFIS